MDRFWAKVNKTPTCWEWNAALLKTGYGAFTGTERKPIRAHRFSWQLHFGEIPDRLLVLHHCDNKKCVRPDHLFLGTHSDNGKDAFRKGIINPIPPRLKGEGLPQAKLTEAIVLEIRAAVHAGGVSMRSLARRYGVTHVAISKAAKGLTWAHVG